MTTEAWIALVSVAMSSAASMIVVAYRLGRLSQRVDGLDEWRRDVSSDVKNILNKLENIAGAIGARKVP